MKKTTEIQKLAEERTKLAAERTTLAYIRTSFTLVLFGLGLLNITHNYYTILFSVISIVVGLGILLLGFFRYLKEATKVKNHMK